MRDKRCAICKAVFTPNCNKQIYCEDCRPYMLRYKNEDKAREHRYADAKKAGTPLSTYPAAPGCEGCRYYRGMTGGGTFKACHYCFDEERKRPCLPGRNCTVRIEKRKGTRFDEDFVGDRYGFDLGLY